MQYFFTNQDGKLEEVAPETWRWEAHYHDGTVLRQFELPENGLQHGKFHQFREIDQTKLAAFKMVGWPAEGDLPIFPVFVLPFDSERMKLVHYYLNTGLNVGTPEFRKFRWYVFGYKAKNKGVSHLTVITHSGEVIMCEDTSILKIE